MYSLTTASHFLENVYLYGELPFDMKASFLLSVAMLCALAVSCRNGGAPIEIENRTFEDEAAYVTTGLDVDLPAAKGAVATAIRAKLAEILYQDICNVSRTGEDPDFEPFADDAADTQVLMGYYGEQLTAALAAASDLEYAERIEGIMESTTLTDSQKADIVKNLDKWAFDYSLKKVGETDRCIVFKSEYYVNYGGTHGGILGAGPLTFSKRDGQLVSEFFQPGSAAQMQPLLREGLREYFGPRMEGTGLDDLDIFLSLPEGGAVPLPEWAPQPVADSLHFIYQQYEIAPYAAGMPEFSLPVGQLKDFLTDDAVRILF